MAAQGLKELAGTKAPKLGHFIVEFATPGIGHNSQVGRLRFCALWPGAFRIWIRDSKKRGPLFRSSRSAGHRSGSVPSSVAPGDHRPLGRMILSVTPRDFYEGVCSVLVLRNRCIARARVILLLPAVAVRHSEGLGRVRPLCCC